MNGDVDGEVPKFFARYNRPAVQYDPDAPFRFQNTKINVSGNNFVVTGVTSAGNSVFLTVRGFRPYFIVEPVSSECTADDVCAGYGALSAEVDMRRTFYGHKTKNKPFFRVYTANLADPDRMRRNVLPFIKQTYEGNMKPVTRFMLDRHITGAGWIEIPAGRHTRVANTDSYCQIEMSAHADDVFGVKDALVASMRAVTFDIETKNREGRFPQPHNNDPVISIACVLENLPDHTRLGLVLFTLKSCEPVEGATVYCFETEEELLVGFAGFLRAFDPDLILGWNSINFDMWYLIRRAQNLGIFEQFGHFDQSIRVHDILLKNFESGALGRQEYYLANYRLQYDLYLLARRDVTFSPSSYTLNYVAQAILGEKKHDMSYNAIATMHEQNTWRNVPDDPRAPLWCAALKTMKHTIEAGKFFLAATPESQKVCDHPFFHRGGFACEFIEFPKRKLVWKLLENYQHDGCTHFRPLVAPKERKKFAEELERFCGGGRVGDLPASIRELSREELDLIDAGMIFFLANGGPIYGAPGSAYGQAWELIMLYNEPVWTDDGRVEWRATDLGRTVIHKYCLQDALLAAQINENRMYVGQYIAIAREAITPLMDLITGGALIRTYCSMVDEILISPEIRHFVVPDYDVDDEEESGGRKVKYKGATVLDPVFGFHEDPTVTLDFASLYPSIMMDNNLCYSTYVFDRKVAKRVQQGYVGFRTPLGAFFITHRELQPHHVAILTEAHIFLTAERQLLSIEDKPALEKLGFGLVYGVVVRVVRGVLPRRLLKFMATRTAAKDVVKDCEVLMLKLKEAGQGGTEEYKRLHARKLAHVALEKAVKVMMNSYYGFTGATLGKLPMLELSAGVTSYGREMIMKTRSMAMCRNPLTLRYGCDPDSSTEEFRNGLTPFITFVIYGDTDSVFVRIFGKLTTEEAVELGIKMTRMITLMFQREHANRPFELKIKLEFEKKITRLLLPSKKKYSMRYFLLQGGKLTEKQESKGLENKRRDTPEFLRELIDKYFALIMGGRENFKMAEELVFDLINDMRAGKIHVSEFVISGSINGATYEKSTPPPHVLLARRIEAKTGEKLTLGTRLFYVMTLKPLKITTSARRGTRDLGSMAETVDTVERKNLEIDIEYYIDKFILGPISRIMFAVEAPPMPTSSQEAMEEFYRNQPDPKVIQKQIQQRILSDDRLRKRKQTIVENSKFTHWLAQWKRE